MRRIGFGHYPMGEVVPSQCICSDEELENTEIYQEFLKPRDWHYGGGVYLANGAGQMAILSGIRSKSLGPLTMEELEWWQSLVPHLSRAVRIHGERKRLAGERDLLRYHFDSSPVGIVQMTEDSLVLAANRRAIELIDRNDALIMKDGRLKALDSRSDNVMQKAIRQAGSPIHNQRSSLTQVRLPRGRDEILALINESPGGGETRIGTNAPTVYCYLIDRSQPHRVDPDILMKSYDLTPAEANVAAHFATGASPEEAAEVLGISANTVRTHLKRIFAKTGCRRQSELVALLLRLPASIK